MRCASGLAGSATFCVLVGLTTISQFHAIALRIGACYIVVTINSNYTGGVIYVRRTKSRGTGPYFQLVMSRRVEGKPRTSVLVHLGEHPTPEDALGAWPSEAEHLRAIGRDGQADKLEAKLNRLRGLIKRRNEAGEEQGANG